MKCFCCLVLTQPVGVHGVPDAFSDSLGLSPFEEPFLLSPHFHLVESFGLSAQSWSDCIVRVSPLGSQDTACHEKHPKSWSWNQLKVLESVSNGD